MNKVFKCGVYVGRFQHIHKGHEYVINKALEMCDKLIIVVGSSQESGTKRNPLPAHIRVNLIKAIYGDKVTIVCIPDRPTYGDDVEWGNYLLNYVETMTGCTPDVIIGGYESVRNNWFDKKSSISQVIINREEVPISGELVRSFLLYSDDVSWYDSTNPCIHRYFSLLRETMQKVYELGENDGK